jgi:hypothetical protein
MPRQRWFTSIIDSTVRRPRAAGGVPGSTSCTMTVAWGSSCTIA